MRNLDSDYLQRQLTILADDMKSDEPKVAKAYLFLKDRLNQSFPDGDVSMEDVKSILREPQGRKHSLNLPDWALNHLFEIRTHKNKNIVEIQHKNIIKIRRIIQEMIGK